MNLRRLCLRLLQVLFVRRQNNEIIDLMDLCAGTGARPHAVLKALQALADAGLVQPRRLRLTLSGLAVASALVSPTTSAVAPACEQAPGRARCAA